MTKTTQPGSKVAKRINERLPKATLAKTADKASVAVKRIPRTKKAPVVSASQSDLTNNPELREQMNGVSKPTVKRVARTKTIVGDAPKSATTAPADAAIVTKRVAKKTVAPKVAAKKTPQPRARIPRPIPAAPKPAAKQAPISTGLSPKAQEAIAAAAKAMDADVLKGKEAPPAKKTATKKSLANHTSPLLTKQQQKDRAALTSDAIALAGRATRAGFVVRIVDCDEPGFDNEITVLTKEVHNEFRAAKKPLLDRYDALVKEIVAAGGQVDGTLTLTDLVFYYGGEKAPKAKKNAK